MDDSRFQVAKTFYLFLYSPTDYSFTGYLKIKDCFLNGIPNGYKFNNIT